ncbi:MAG TPA: hypothetical protein VK166_12125 [Chitinophagaceae bacterium]|nr:hypothetical protein [Chitinophagaceae bacterium]
MKHTNSLSLISLFLVVFTMSCSKDDAVPSNVSTQVREEAPIKLTARAWTTDQSGRFVCTFIDFMHSSGDANAVSTAKVYLLSDNDQIVISFGPVTYMSGNLWSEQEGKDLKVYYQPFVAQTVVPFEKLDLMVEKQ